MHFCEYVCHELEYLDRELIVKMIAIFLLELF